MTAARELDAGDLDLLRRWLRREAGLRATDYRDEFLARRVIPRMEAAGFSSLGRYLVALDRSEEQRNFLIRRLLVPTTEFFRNADVFEALGRAWAGLQRSQPLKLLSAPCSTGEEAVSLAILLERLNLKGTIVAADLSATALATLKAGQWPLRALEKLDTATAARYFSVEGGWATLSPQILQRIEPVRWDLGQGMPGRGYHTVLMRNLFIYLKPEAQARMVREVAKALLPGGLLVLGRVEPLPDGEGWETVDRDARLYRWKGVAR